MYYVLTPSQWWTRYWKFYRRLEAGPMSAAGSKRFAELMLKSLPVILRGQANEAHALCARAFLEGVVDHGREAFEAELSNRKAAAELGKG